MLKKLIATLGRVFSFFIGLIVAVILGVTTWAFWELYQEEKLQNQFIKEGTLISVSVDRADYKQRSWRDILGNSVYLTFRYKNKLYSTRYVRDSIYTGAGDQVNLLYHPQYDAFRQPGSEVHFDRSTRKSRLLNWSTISTFSDENRLLLMCIILSTATFFLATGVLVTLLPLTFLQTIARLVLTVELFIAVLFFSYDTWAYWQYYQLLKSKGQQVRVRVLGTDRIADSHRTNHSRGTIWYTYQATIQYEQQERVIPISEDDYETVKPTDSLNAWYNESMNDFMSVDFPPDYSRLVMPLFFGIITFVLIRSTSVRKKQNPQTVSR